MSTPPFRRRHDDAPAGDSNMWLTTFTDTIALLLTFFVLTFAMSHPKQDVWDDFSNKVQDNFNRFYGAPLNRGAQDTITIDSVDLSRALDLTYLTSLMEAQLAEQPALAPVTMQARSHSLVLSLPPGSLFEEGQSDISAEGRKILYALAPILRRLANRVEIVGHAGADEQTPGQALIRATAASSALQLVGYERKVTVRGAAAQGQVGLDIVIMEDDGKQVTLFDVGMP